MEQSRRKFLRNAGLGLVGAGLGMSLPGASKAIDFSFQPDFDIIDPDLNLPNHWDDLINPCPSGKRILEIVLYGGVSPWETFWVGSGGDDFFVNDSTGLYANVDMRGSGDLVKNFDWCNSGPIANRVKHFGEDDAGHSVYWGPATSPLWDPSIFNSARMITFGHNKNVHELAMPIALTGLPIGNARAAGLGAAISNHFSASCSNQNRPLSYVLRPDDVGGTWRNITASIVATGSHGGANRPVELTVGENGLGDLFLDAEPDPEIAEALNALREQYRQRLRWQGNPGDHVRSPQFDDYRSAASALENSSALHDLLGGDVLAASPGQSCEEFPVSTDWDRTARSLEVAALLLDPDQGNARYVGMLDAGFGPTYKFGGAPYDTHEDAGFSQKHIPATLANLYNCLSNLRRLIDQGDIDLDTTMVVLTTEMGRTPNLHSTHNGREHWSSGTVQIFLGCEGPRGIVGAINESGYSRAPADVDTDQPFQSAHARAAVLKAAGVNPVSQDTFSLGDLLGPLSAPNDLAMSNLIGSRILGV